MSQSGTGLPKRIELVAADCLVQFSVRSEAAGYFRFDVSLHFPRLAAKIPQVCDCSLSKREVARLVEVLSESLSRPPHAEVLEAEMLVFQAYDAFFRILVLEDDTVRVMLDYGPQHACSLGVEFRPTTEEVTNFRDGWAGLLD